jgi:hypothetical protein
MLHGWGTGAAPVAHLHAATLMPERLILNTALANALGQALVSKQPRYPASLVLT